MASSREQRRIPSSEDTACSDSLEVLSKMNESNKNSSVGPKAAEVFSSVEFGKFLSTEFGQGRVFLSKDSPNSFPSLESSLLFKSKETFSKLFASNEWRMEESTTSDEKNAKKEQPTICCDEDVQVKDEITGALSSKEWMPMKTLGSHIDVAYSHDMFRDANTSSSPVGGGVIKGLAAPQKTKWNDIFLSQLQQSASLYNTTEKELEKNHSPGAAVAELDAVSDDTTTANHQMAEVAIAALPQTPTKRKRKPRKKIVPDVKEYVSPTENDVLLGRG